MGLPRQHPLLGAGAALVFLLLSQRGCTSAPRPRILLKGLPAETTAVEVMVARRGAGRYIDRTLRGEAPPAGGAELVVTDDIDGDVALGGVAFNDRRCIIAVGSNAEAVVRREAPALLREARAELIPSCGQRPPRVLELVLERLEQPDCMNRSPRVIDARPAQARAGARVTLRGYSIREGATVKVGGKEAAVTWRSPTLLEVSVPAGLPPGRAAVRLENPDTTFDEQPDLLTIDS